MKSAYHMRSSQLFFFSTCAFLSGIISGGVGLPPVFAAVSIGILTVTFILVFKLRLFITLAFAIFFLVGNLYYTVDEYIYIQKQRGIEQMTSFEGIVSSEPRRSEKAQLAKVKIHRADTEGAEGASLYVRLEEYPHLSYGDVVHMQGEIVPPPNDSYGRYMLKEHVHGSLFYPDTQVVGNEANPLFKTLFDIRTVLENTLGRLFSAQQAAFLSGIMLGDKDGFSPEFSEKLSASGTMHLMALSGLNMTIIVFVVLGISSLLFRRERLQMTGTFSVVALFVAMTGFQVSAIRAALMAFLVGFADASGRIYNPRNAIAFAALLITLWNPQAPVFDLAFQLSFLATIAIIYLVPLLQQLSLFKKPGVLGWRDILAITLAAQIGVFPLTIIHFANFSFTSLLANIAILAVIPFLTVFGFVIVGCALIFEPLGVLLAKPAAFLINYVVFIVETFASVRLPFNPDIGAFGAVLYYIAILWVWWRYSPSSSHHEKS